MSYQRQRIAQQHEPRRIIRQLVRKLVHVFVHLIPGLRNFERLFVDLVFFSIIHAVSLWILFSPCRGVEMAAFDGVSRLLKAASRGGEVHMTACGSLAREVLSRNLRNLSLVSCEKVYRRDSEAWRSGYQRSGRVKVGAGWHTMMKIGGMYSTMWRNGLNVWSCVCEVKCGKGRSLSSPDPAICN